MLVVDLVPAAARPWVGGSRTDDPLDLAFGYNGLGRLTGNETGGGAAALRSGSLLRLFGSAAGQVGWLLPAALVAAVAGLVLRRGRPRTDPLRAALLMWGGWLLTTALVFSAMQGIWHSYYTVEMAPAVAATVAIGATLLWRRQTAGARVLLALGSLLTTAWAVSVIDRLLLPGNRLAAALLATGLAAVLAVAAGGRWRPARLAGAVLLLTAALVGPAAWSLATVVRPHIGSAVEAGPADVDLFEPSYARPDRPLSASALALLRRDPDDWTWTAAVVGHRAADIQLSAGAPVMPIGGFFARDPSPTLAQFRVDVAERRLHWYVPGGAGGARPS